MEQFRTGKAFDLVANGFWTPDLEKITVQVVAASKVDGVGIGLWERRLIHDREPVFNWPIQRGEDDEERGEDREARDGDQQFEHADAPLPTMPFHQSDRVKVPSSETVLFDES